MFTGLQQYPPALRSAWGRGQRHTPEARGERPAHPQRHACPGELALQPGFFLAKRRPGASPLLTAPHPTPQAGRPVTQALGHFSRLSRFIYGVAEGTAWRFSLRLVQLDGFLGALLMGPFIHGTSMPRGAPSTCQAPRLGCEAQVVTEADACVSTGVRAGARVRWAALLKLARSWESRP